MVDARAKVHASSASFQPSFHTLAERRVARRRRTLGVVVAGVVAIGLLGMLSLAIGSRDLPLTDVWQGLTHRGASTPESIIVWQLRMPRTALAVIVGSALAVAGVLMQSLTRNPLAEPGLLGVNAGAAFAVVVAISVLGVGSIAGYLWFALGGAAVTACFVYVISVRRTHRSDHARLVLAGAALSASLGALTGVITMFDTQAFNSYRFWVIGSVAERGTDVLAQVFPFVVVGLVLGLLSGPALNALALGDEQATSLGARLPVVRATTFVAITVLCGAATAAAGPIGFVGLAVPHLLRLLIGVEMRLVLVLSILIGPVLMLSADILGRVVTRPHELEAGIVTAFIGAPVLLLLLTAGRKQAGR